MKGHRTKRNRIDTVQAFFFGGGGGLGVWVGQLYALIKEIHKQCQRQLSGNPEALAHQKIQSMRITLKVRHLGAVTTVTVHWSKQSKIYQKPFASGPVVDTIQPLFDKLEKNNFLAARDNCKIENLNKAYPNAVCMLAPISQYNPHYETQFAVYWMTLVFNREYVRHFKMCVEILIFQLRPVPSTNEN